MKKEDLGITATIALALKQASVKLNYPCAHLHLVKTPGGAFLTDYYHFNRNIAFRKTEDGKAINLICIEESPAASWSGWCLPCSTRGNYEQPVV
jgi:hypothetical protein